jgi:hypothetical protein
MKQGTQQSSRNDLSQSKLQPGVRGWKMALLILGVAGFASLFLSAVTMSVYLLVSPKPIVANKNPCQNSQKYVCYSKYFKARTNAVSPKAALTELGALAKTNSFVLSQCHQLTHSVGHAAFDKYGSLTKAYSQGDSYCWSGYYHGVTESAVGVMSKQQLKSQLNTICSELAEKSRYSFDHYNCAHGLGHGLLGVEDDNLFTALVTCDSLNDPWERSSCYGGAFMENVMIESRENGKSQYLRAEEPMYPCTAVAVVYKDQCYGMQTSYALSVSGNDFAKVAQLCQDLSDVDYVGKCYRSLGRDASGSTNSDIVATKQRCELALDAEGKKNCMIGAALDIASYYRDDVQAKAFCLQYEGELRFICHRDVVNYTANFKPSKS